MVEPGPVLRVQRRAGNTQYRFLWDDQRVTPFRKPSNNSNGNAFDFQGRQISREDYFRRVVRWEHDGTMTVIADQFEGKPLNSPNDLVAHPDGSIWFTDPPYGDTLSEGHPGRCRRPDQSAAACSTRASAPRTPERSAAPSVNLPNAVYRWDPSGRLDVVVTEDQLPDPNGHLLLAGLQDALCNQYRQGAGRHPCRRHRHHLCVRRAGHQGREWAGVYST